jgi:hypothetical protein
VTTLVSAKESPVRTTVPSGYSDSASFGRALLPSARGGSGCTTSAASNIFSEFTKVSNSIFVIFDGTFSHATRSDGMVIGKFTDSAATPIIGIGGAVLIDQQP